MDPRSHVIADDRPCPVAFLVTAAFTSGLVWLVIVLGQMSVQ